MTSGGEDIEGGGGGGYENFKTPKRGALKKLLGYEGASENLYTSKPTGEGGS